MDNRRCLKIQRGTQVFGPFSVTELAELLAAGRFAEVDRVSENGGSWTSIEEFVARRDSPAPAETPVPRDGEFVCLAAPTPEATANGPDSDYVLDSHIAAKGESTDDDAPLAESRDPADRKQPARGAAGETFVFPATMMDEDAGSSLLPAGAATLADDRHHAPPPRSVMPDPWLDEMETEPPRQSRRKTAAAADLHAVLPEESQLDDILSALAEDEANADAAKRTLPRRPRPAGPKSATKRRKR